MEARVLLVCLFAAAIVHGEQAPAGLCRSNERLLMCGCPRTCRDPAPDCKAVCRPGCFCEDGQFRNDEGLCVNLADCPPILSAYKQDTTEPRPNGGKCPDNQEYRYCEPCNKTCDNPNPICPAQCSRGCFCKNGLLRDKDGSCVTPDKCSNSTVVPAPNATQDEVVCGIHQVYKRCENFEKTCNTPNPRVPEPCATGCFCQEGYVKAPNGQCVKFEECPKVLPAPNATQNEVVCGIHQVYKRCENFEKTCNTPNPRVPEPCAMGCFCQEGYVKAPNGQCVKFEECPKGTVVSAPNATQNEVVCGIHQVYKSCENFEKTCNRPNPRNPEPCAMGCFCQEGYVKAPNGQCVKFEECPKGLETRTILGTTTPAQNESQLVIGLMVHDSQPYLHYPSVEDCSPDEEYFFCGWCEPSCSNPLPTCPNKVCMRGCQCRPPLLRHHSGRCVEAKDCFPENCNNPNEEFVCLFGCELRCDGRVCVQPQYCVLGCYCRIGLLRDTTGLCVRKDRCTNSTDIKGVPVNLKKKLSNDDKVYKSWTWKSLDELV